MEKEKTRIPETGREKIRTPAGIRMIRIRTLETDRERVRKKRSKNLRYPFRRRTDRTDIM